MSIAHKVLFVHARFRFASMDVDFIARVQSVRATMLDLNEKRNINIRQLIIHKQVINKKIVEDSFRLSTLLKKNSFLFSILKKNYRKKIFNTYCTTRSKIDDNNDGHETED